MKQNRRQFLKFFGLTVSAVATAQIKPVFIDNNLYCNRKLGLSLRIPNEWEILSYHEYASIMNEGKLDCYDEDLEKELKENIGTPLLAIQGPEATKEHVIPTIHLWAQSNDRPDDHPVIVHTESYEYFGEMFKDYSFLTRPTPTTFCNLSASYCRVKFTSETNNGCSEPVILDSYLFPRGPVGYTINFMDHERGWSPKTIHSFNDFTSSISFAS